RNPSEQDVQLERLPKALELFQQLDVRLIPLVARQALLLVGRGRLVKDLAGGSVDKTRPPANAAGPEAPAGPSQLDQVTRPEVRGAVRDGLVAERRKRRRREGAPV
ncbi:hypothetical protein THAOC_14602, partial [Thalassiosira oceanica]